MWTRKEHDDRNAHRMAASVIKEQHNERRHLGLFWSQNLENWVCAGLVASGCADNAARHYATLAIDGEDLLILSRSGDANACTAHNNNMQTLHRIKDFRRFAI